MSISLQTSPTSSRHVFHPITVDQGYDSCNNDEEEVELSMIAMHQEEEGDGTTTLLCQLMNCDNDYSRQRYQFELDWDLTKLSECDDVDSISFAVSDDMSMCSDIARDRLFEHYNDDFSDNNSLISVDDTDCFIETCDWKSIDIFESKMITPAPSPVSNSMMKTTRDDVDVSPTSIL